MHTILCILIEICISEHKDDKKSEGKYFIILDLTRLAQWLNHKISNMNSESFWPHCVLGPLDVYTQ